MEFTANMICFNYEGIFFNVIMQQIIKFYQFMTLIF